MSKCLAMILHPFFKTSPHTINNANDFLTNIKDLKLEPDEIMISFDVVSLFTSIPLDTTKRITNELLTNNDRSKLHLNNKGSTLLAVRFIKFLGPQFGSNRHDRSGHQGFQIALLKQLGGMLMMMGNKR